MSVENQTYRVQWMFVGSMNNRVASSVKPREHLIRKEKGKYSKYLDREEKPTTIEKDHEKLIEAFYDRYEENEDLYCNNVLKNDQMSVMERLENFFNTNKYNASLVVYSGNAEKGTGNWLIESCDNYGNNKVETVDFDDIIIAWRARKHPKKNFRLLIIHDGNYSGTWCKRLFKNGTTSVSIQASCQANQKSAEDKHIGSIFLHNFFKVVTKKNSERIFEPRLTKQWPKFYGSFTEVFKYFGLLLKYNSWWDMKLAVGITKWGDWPKVSIPLGFGGYLGENNKKTMADVLGVSPDEVGDDPLGLGAADGGALGLGAFGFDNEDPDMAYYEGDVDNAMRNGFGIQKNDTGDILYEGQWKDNYQHGKGMIYYPNGNVEYEGDIEYGVREGYGQRYYPDGTLMYDGWWKGDKFEGKGKFYWPNGVLKYDGEWKDGKEDGFGILYDEDGNKIYEGYWKNGKFHGDGIEWHPDGRLKYKGEYKNGKPSGFGREYYDNGQVKYEGGFLEGLYHGYGKIFNSEGELQFEGMFRFGRPEGDGIAYYMNGNVLYKGDFENGKMNGIGDLGHEEGHLNFVGTSENILKQDVLGNIYLERLGTKHMEKSVEEEKRELMKEKRDALRDKRAVCYEPFVAPRNPKKSRLIDKESHQLKFARTLDYANQTDRPLHEHLYSTVTTKNKHLPAGKKINYKNWTQGKRAKTFLDKKAKKRAQHVHSDIIRVPRAKIKAGREGKKVFEETLKSKDDRFNTLVSRVSRTSKIYGKQARKYKPWMGKMVLLEEDKLDPSKTKNKVFEMF